MNWSLVIIYVAMGATTASPAVVVHQIDFPSEQSCVAAKATLARDWSTSLAGSKMSYATSNASASCVNRQ